ASPARRARRLERGRPSQDERDQLVIDVACAFATAYGLGPQRARDLALGGEGEMMASIGKLSFGLRRPIRARSETVRQKQKRMRPRPAVASAIVLLIRGKDVAAIKRCLHSLLSMQAISAERTKKLIEQLVGKK